MRNATETDEITRLMENGRVDYLLYTGAVKDATVGDFIRLHRRAMQLGIPCLTSVDTAQRAGPHAGKAALTASNTELVDINRMRAWRQKIHFAKMHSCGNDNIFIENFDQRITCPESLCVSLCAPHYGIGGDGIVLIETSRIADAKMRAFNRDGSEGRMAGNSIRCVAKYLYDKGYIRSEHMTIETVSGVHSLQLYLRNGKVSSVSVDMGRPDWLAAHLPARTDERELVAYPMQVDDRAWRVSCLSVGNPHCVVFCDAIDGLELETLGPQFEYAELFPERINTEFVRVVNPTNLRIRVWERGNGETFACGTGACAAVGRRHPKRLLRKGYRNHRAPQGRRPVRALHAGRYLPDRQRRTGLRRRV